MSLLPFTPDRKMTDVLGKEPFTLSAEIIPPRNGTEQAAVLTQIDRLIRSGAQFLAVTKGAGGSLRGGSLPIAQAIKEKFGVPCIAHFTCRDLTPMEVENHLIDHHYFGIRNILALRGDPPDGQTEWKPREGGYHFAYELIRQIRKLNQGEYLPRQGGPASLQSEATDFCVGAAVYPEHPNEKERIEFFRQKVAAGAEYGITDVLFDPEAYARFMDLCAAQGLSIPVLPGTRILRTQKQAERMAAKFKVQIPKALRDALPSEDGPDAMKRGLELFLKFTDRLRALGAPGVHLFVILDTEAASQGLLQLSSGRSQATNK